MQSVILKEALQSLESDPLWNQVPDKIKEEAIENLYLDVCEELIDSHYHEVEEKHKPTPKKRTRKPKAPAPSS